VTTVEASTRAEWNASRGHTCHFEAAAKKVELIFKNGVVPQLDNAYTCIEAKKQHQPRKRNYEKPSKENQQWKLLI
jgi:hypothetical protein